MKSIEYAPNSKDNALTNGLKHGETFKSDINELYAIRKDLLSGYLRRWTADQIKDLAIDMVETLKAYSLDYEEFRGISKASGLEEWELMVLNNYTDMRDFWAGDDLDRNADGCSVLSVRAGKTLICGQTWDMHASAQNYVLNIEIPKGEFPGASILTVTGCLGLAGVNDLGVSVLINNMHCRETSRGLMWSALVRSMLREKTAKAGVGFLQNSLPCSGHNYLICDHDETYNVETTGTRAVVTSHFNGNGVTFHTNHYVSDLNEVEILGRQSKTTFKRYDELEKYFATTKIESRGYDGIAQDILSGEVLKSVCIDENPEKPHAAMTCGGLIYDYAAHRGEVFQGFYADGNRRPIQFTELKR